MDVRRSRCETTRRLACARLDGALSPFEQVLFARHVADCAACRSFAADVEAIGRLLREAPPESLSRPLVVPVRGRRLAPRLAGLAAAAAVAAALAALLAGPESRTGPQPQSQAGVGAFDVDRDLRDLRRDQLKPPLVRVPGVRSLQV